MLKTAISDLFNIQHPVVMGGMGSYTSPELVAAVSNAGGLGVLGCSRRPPQDIAQAAEEIRRLTDRPFGMNLLLFRVTEEEVDAVLEANPPVFSTAWAFPEQDLSPIFVRAHEAGARVMHMVSTVPEAQRAAEAGADAIVAQGSEGGGHVGVMGTLPLVRMVARAVAPVPVLAAGGVADGAGLAAALALGAEGVLLGSRFLATPESPLSPAYKQAIIDSDGHDTALTEIPDIATGSVWPGAYSRTLRNRLIQDWIGREGELRYRRAEVAQRMQQAARDGDTDYVALNMGQTSGLIDGIQPAGEIVAEIVREAQDILGRRLHGMLAQ